MFHDRYSRRRAADSFHDDDQEGQSESQNQWSWALFFGVILVQVTSRSVWASFGIISIFIFGDQGPSWLLLATPIAFAIAWGLTEPWIKRICKNLNSATEFMYIIVAGTVIAWFGTLIAAKSPMALPFLIPLLGVITGCGSNVMTTASTSLVKKHFPARSGAIRFFEQVTASLSFFLMPIISCFIMQSYGEHGGLLIHGGILMQGFIGSCLLSSAQWKSDVFSNRRPRSLTFVQYEDDTFSPYGAEADAHWEEQVPFQQMDRKKLARESITNSEQLSKNIAAGKRIAFGLAKAPDTPPEKRKTWPVARHSGLLPSIQEITEDEEDEIDSPKKVGNMQKEAEALRRVPSSPVNTLPKPPRTFNHRFSAERLVPQLNSPEVQGLPYYWSAPSATEPAAKSDVPDLNATLKNELAQDCSIPLRMCTSEVIRGVSVIWHEPWWRLSTSCDEVWEWLLHPLTIPAALLMYATHSCLLGFLTLTPALLDAFIDDGTRMDGAYCVCVMGFTWFCFVLASPCFSTIHFSNHQTICIVALVSSSITLYMVSQSSTIDEMVLYSSLFGLSYGVARMTSYSVLKMSFGSETLNDLGVLLSVIASVFQILFFLIVVTWDWCHHLKNLYKFQVVALVCSAMFWTVQSCLSSVRAKRGQHEFTWSRRRRIS